ncbi:MAG: sigma-70 family RNA polymerase sigma factor [Bacteroidetes bacterium]|jgi:RNA polymerase sigma factor (TIGR02999 family)|nr:sigma-70 family RNA polymerase sigma factor [Bacteroidota bacterium]
MPFSESNSGSEKYSKERVTQLLQSSKAGDEEVVNQLLPLVYDEMSSIAHQKLQFERNGHTLDTTALVHEAYFKLVNHDEVEWQSRAHFLAISALAMKRILINYAKKKKAIKRGGEFSRVELKEVEREMEMESMSESMADEILALNKALKKMEDFNKRGSQVVEYHFFGGLTWKEISEVMGIAPITVRRAWNVAKLWLKREFKETNMPSLTVRRQK